jgi:hypothetical protein|tara:strand:- start:3898 stop:4317 length:420 start_codon:yes stop_codon:yes gene_type:complete
MSRRNDLIQQLIASEKFGPEKEQEQKFLMATAELILSDLINIALNGVEKHGPGSLVINLLNDSTTFMWAESIEFDLQISERENDTDVNEFLRKLLQEINENDWSQNVLITLISDAGTRTFAVEAGRSQESFRALAEEFI